MIKKSLEVISNSITSFSSIDPDMLTYQIRSYPQKTNLNHIKQAEEIFSSYTKSNDHNALRFAASYAGALAYHYENINEITKSEDYFLKMNGLIDRVRDYKPLQTQKVIKDIIKSFNSSPEINLDKNYGNEMIFIVGMPRSGTTLMESIVADVPDIHTGGELGSFKNLIQFEITTFSKNNPEQIKSFLQKYLDKMNFIKKDKKFLIDKLPFNAFLIGFILKYLPGAKVILVNRNPWDIAKSVFKTVYFDKHYYSTKFFNIAMQIANFNFIKNYWLMRFDKNENIFEISYEDLVLDPIKKSTEIYRFLKINHSLDLENRKKFYSNTSSYSQVKQDIGKSDTKIDMFGRFKEQFYKDLHSQGEYWRNTDKKVLH